MEASPGHSYRCWYPVGSAAPTQDFEADGIIEAPANLETPVEVTT
jgi:hypothetical protein